LSELVVRSTTRTTGLRVAGAWAKYLRDAGHHSAQSVRSFYEFTYYMGYRKCRPKDDTGI
jgi:hypothetical protein